MTLLNASPLALQEVTMPFSSFANKDDMIARVKAQVGGSLIEEAVEPGLEARAAELASNVWCPDPEQEPNGRSVRTRLSRIGALQGCAGVLFCGRKVKDDGTAGDPFVMVGGPPIGPNCGDEGAEVELPSVEAWGMQGDSWKPSNIKLGDKSKSLVPIVVPLVANTRGCAIDSLKTIMFDAASSILVLPKGLGVVSCALCSDIEAPSLADPWAPFWVSKLDSVIRTGEVVPPVIKGFVPTEEDQQPDMSGAWLMPLVLPLPEHHGIPFGFGVPVTPDLTLASFLRQLRDWTHTTAAEFQWLEKIPLLSSWFVGVAASPKAFAQQVLTYAQVSESLPPFWSERMEGDFNIHFELFWRDVTDRLVFKLLWDRVKGSASANVLKKVEMYGLAAVTILSKMNVFSSLTSVEAHPYLLHYVRPGIASWDTTLELTKARNIMKYCVPKGAENYAPCTLSNLSSSIVLDDLPELVDKSSLAGLQSPSAENRSASQDPSQRQLESLFGLPATSTASDLQSPEISLATSVQSSRAPGGRDSRLDTPSFTRSQLFGEEVASGDKGGDRARTVQWSVGREESRASPVQGSSVQVLGVVSNPVVGHVGAANRPQPSDWKVPADVLRETEYPQDMVEMLPVLTTPLASDVQAVYNKFHVTFAGAETTSVTLEAKIFASIGGIKFPDSTLTTAPVFWETNKDKSFLGEDWLFLGGRVSRQWVANVLAAKEWTSVASHLDMQVQQQQTQESGDVFWRSIGRVSYPEGFFSQHSELVQGLQKGFIHSGLDIAWPDRTKLRNEFTIWHLLASVLGNQFQANKLVPAQGISADQLVQLLVNYLFIFVIMFQDVMLYPELAKLTHYSPWTIASPFAGGLICLIQHFSKPGVRLAWDQLLQRQDKGTKYAVCSVLYHVGKLVDIFTQWVSKPLFPKMVREALPPSSRQHVAKDLCLITTAVNTLSGQMRLLDDLKAWHKHIEVRFNPSALRTITCSDMPDDRAIPDYLFAASLKRAPQADSYQADKR
jgi:hypothetical protein